MDNITKNTDQRDICRVRYILNKCRKTTETDPSFNKQDREDLKVIAQKVPSILESITKLTKKEISHV